MAERKGVITRIKQRLPEALKRLPSSTHFIIDMQEWHSLQTSIYAANDALSRGENMNGSEEISQPLKEAQYILDQPRPHKALKDFYEIGLTEWNGKLELQLKPGYKETSRVVRSHHRETGEHTYRILKIRPQKQPK